MSHKMGQSAYWAWCCCWLLTGQDGVQCVCSGGAAGDFEFPFRVLLATIAHKQGAAVFYHTDRPPRLNSLACRVEDVVATLPNEIRRCQWHALLRGYFSRGVGFEHNYHGLGS